MYWIIFLLIIILIIILILCFLIKKKHIYHVPRVIYTFWDRIEENEIMQAIMENRKKQIPPGWELIVLSKSTVDRYVNADLLAQWSDVGAVRFSDFLRVYLLSKNGGVWMDAGILITNGNFLEQYRQEMMETKADVLLYEYKRYSTPGQPYLENWFFMCPKNSHFMKDLCHEFMTSFSVGFLQYKNEVLAPHVSFEHTLLKGQDTYHMQHGIISYMMKTRKDRYTGMIIKDAQESMFKAQDAVNWDHKELIRQIIGNHDWSQYYAIKLTGANREPITECQEEFIKRIQEW